MLELQSLTRTYGDRVAVNNVTASLQGGEVVGFLGPNGAGKTTTMKLIAGLLIPSRGHVRIDGHDVVKDAVAAKSRLAYIPDRPYVPERLSARELFHYVAGLYGIAGDVIEARGMAELQRFGLKGREDDLLGSYSHGMRQRVLLACALMRDPRVLLVDEPMVGLDPQGMALVKSVLVDVAKRGAVVLMSTHTLDVVEQVCDRVLVMRRGELVLDDSIAGMKARAEREHQDTSIEPLFLSLTGASSDGDTDAH